MRAAEPDPGPRATLLRVLDGSLRAEQRKRHAGIALTAEGDVEVFAVGPSESRFAAIVNEIRFRVAPDVTVRVIPDQRNSLESLEELQRRITASHERLRAYGIELLEYGVDIRANRLRLGVETPTSDVVARLEAEFGRDAVRVVRGQRFRAC